MVLVLLLLEVLQSLLLGHQLLLLRLDLLLLAGRHLPQLGTHKVIITTSYYLYLIGFRVDRIIISCG